MLGAALLAAGLVVLVQAFVRFVVEGLGTPAPVAPTEHLVVGGLYRHVRNPMYLALGAIIVGQALVLGRPALLLYAAAFVAVTATFVRVYEEPALRRAFGAEYEAYRRAVPGLVAATARVAPGRGGPSVRAPVAALRRADVLAAASARAARRPRARRGSCARPSGGAATGRARGGGVTVRLLQRSRSQPRVVGRVAARGAHERGLGERQPGLLARARSPA